ncbi:hypothetical protein HMI56_006286 [Coelomomyces lativittatus]|nr:hypothetical protein HMI56_006286 [Coelomomyces lativittatus]
MPFDPTMFIKACIMISCQENNHPMPELPSSNLSNAVLKIRKTCSLTYVPKLEPFLVRMSWTNTDLSQVRNLVQSVLDHRGSNSTFTLEEQFRWEVVTLFVLYGRKQVSF